MAKTFLSTNQNFFYISIKRIIYFQNAKLHNYRTWSIEMHEIMKIKKPGLFKRILEMRTN